MSNRRKRKARIVALRWTQSAEQRRITKAYAELQRISDVIVADMERCILTLQESFRNIFVQLAENAENFVFTRE